VNVRSQVDFIICAFSTNSIKHLLPKRPTFRSLSETYPFFVWLQLQALLITGSQKMTVPSRTLRQGATVSCRVSRDLHEIGLYHSLTF